MNDSDRIAVMMYQLLMHYEVELDEKVDNARRMLDQMPTPEMAQRYGDAMQAREQFKDIAQRLRGVLDFFRGDGV